MGLWKPHSSKVAELPNELLTVRAGPKDRSK